MMPGNRTLVDFPAPQKQGANPAEPAAPEGVPDYQSAFPRHAPVEPVEPAKPSVNVQNSSVPPKPTSAMPPLIPPPAPSPITPAPAVMTPAPVMSRVEKPVLKPVGTDTVKPVAPVKPVAAAAPAPAPTPAGPKVVRGGISWGKWAFAALSVVVVGQGVVIAGLVKWSSAPAAVTPPPQPAPPPPVAAAPPVAAPVTPPPPAQGHVEISSEPDGAKVIVDGTERGVTPLVLPLDPGSHSVIITDGRSTTTRTLEVAAGANVTLAATLAPVGLAAGYVTIASPIELQVSENGQMLGTTATQKLLLPAGKHTLEVANEALEFRSTITVDVQAGKTSKANVPLPNGSISVNALPWAIVWIDGKDVGTTPVATLTVPIGNHEVIWRHPQFGERKQTVSVTAKMPVRLVMDFNR
jgi:hypothetical protein